MVQQSVQTSPLECSVLVLNRAYLPVHVVSARRGIVLLYRELAEVVHIENGHYNHFDFEQWLEFSDLFSEEKLPGDDWIRGTGFELQVPRIIRLYRYDRVPRPTLRFNRRNLFARDENRCQYCDRCFPAQQLSFDHVIPKSRGGETSWTNVVCCCLRCNTSKGNRTPNEAGMKLTRSPKRPQFSPVLTMKLENPKYETWRAFVKNQPAASTRFV